METTSPATLLQRVSSPGYASKVSEVALRLTQATEPSLMQSLMCEGTRALGAESAVFMSLAREGADVSTGHFMLACEPEWCRQYLAAGLIAHDIWLAYAAHHSQPVLASSLYATDTSQSQAIDLAAHHGFASAVVVPAHSGGGPSRMGLLCLGSSRPGFFEAQGCDVFMLYARMLALALHDGWLTRLRRDLIVKARITPSDVVLLRHEWHGHTSKRIAAELQVSKNSVNCRFQRMNARLGVVNRRTAARLAVECGLILP
jgi:hypothetical protein